MLSLAIEGFLFEGEFPKGLDPDLLCGTVWKSKICLTTALKECLCRKSSNLVYDLTSLTAEISNKLNATNSEMQEGESGQQRLGFIPILYPIKRRKWPKVKLLYVIADLRACLQAVNAGNSKFGVKAVGSVLKCDEVGSNKPLTSKKIYHLRL